MEYVKSLRGYSLSPASPQYLLAEIREAIINSIQSNLQIEEIFLGRKAFDDYCFLNNYDAFGTGVIRSKNGMTIKLDLNLKDIEIKVTLKEAASQ